MLVFGLNLIILHCCMYIYVLIYAVWFLNTVPPVTCILRDRKLVLIKRESTEGTVLMTPAIAVLNIYFQVFFLHYLYIIKVMDTNDLNLSISINHWCLWNIPSITNLVTKTNILWINPLPRPYIQTSTQYTIGR